MLETILLKSRMKNSTKQKIWPMPSNWKDSAVRNEQNFGTWHTRPIICSVQERSQDSSPWYLISFYLQWSGVDVLDFLVVDVHRHDPVYRRRTPLHKCLSQLEQGCGKHRGKRNVHTHTHTTPTPLPTWRKM